MKAMILAAGRGERMMPLTANTPKPMLNVVGKPLIQYQIEKLKAAGITELVINHAWCGKKIVNYFGDGDEFGVQVQYSDESSGALETAGGIAKALPLLGSEPFIVVNGDVFTEFDFSSLPVLSGDKLAHLILVDNPEHNLGGDFSLTEGQLRLKSESRPSYTFAGISIYRPEFFEEISGEEKLALGPKLRQYAEKGLVSASYTQASWVDVGTPERLACVEQMINQA